MTKSAFELADLGWTAHFATQFDPGDAAESLPARVMAVHRDRLVLAGVDLDVAIPPFVPGDGDADGAATVGDWLLLDAATRRPRRVLSRRSLFKRRAAGTGRQVQLIAANVDTLLVVTSCNQDFNVARLERYLALARDADVTPVVVLTKADLSDAVEDFAATARKLQRGLLVESVDARDPASTACLSAWCGRGQTVAFVGSSGVGKSTLVNTLSGGHIATQAIRADDDKGRHTTTARQLHRLREGGWLLDTPGMRELQLTDVASGIDDLFSDVADLASACRFGDCRHDSEPGCAVKAAIADGRLDAGRVARWRKLRSEDARNSATLAERRAQERAFGRMARRILSDKQERRR